jgi:hypothetical protein
MGSFCLLYLIFSFIWVRNPLSFTLSLLNLLTDGIFTLDIPILLILLFNTILLFVSWLTTAYSWPIVTTCESILAIFVSPINPKVVTVVGVALGSILFDKLFLISTITVVVIVLYGEVSSTYMLI